MVLPALSCYLSSSIFLSLNDVDTNWILKVMEPGEKYIREHF